MFEFGFGLETEYRILLSRQSVLRQFNSQLRDYQNSFSDDIVRSVNYSDNIGRQIALVDETPNSVINLISIVSRQ